jgi:RHS repeat-associated protein
MQDAIGNVVGLSQNGTALQSNTYDSWGSPAVSGSTATTLLWKGLAWQGDTVGLYYVRNRWYDPEGGRFMSEDPAGFVSGVNLYAFAGNDPVNGGDPSGLCTEDEIKAFIEISMAKDGDQILKCKGASLATVVIMAAPFRGGSGFSENFGNPNARGGSGFVDALAGFGDYSSNGGTAAFRETYGGNADIHPHSDAYAAGAAVAYAVRQVLTGSIGSELLFARHIGLLNSNRYLRIGFGQDRGWFVFRAAGEWVKNLPAPIYDALGGNNGHIFNFYLWRL